MLRQPLKTQNLVASAARTASGNSGLLQLNELDGASVTFKLSCSAASGTTPTLDLYVQTTDDGGASWKDSGHFTQLTAAAANPHYLTVPINGTPVSHGAVGDATIAANTVGIPLLDRAVRVKWVIGGTTPSFTFAVDAFLNNISRNG